MENKKYGLIIDKFEPDHYVLGGGMIGTLDINPSGQWDDFLPKNENQFNGNFDSMNCSAYGTLHALSTLNNFLYAESIDYSERYTGITDENTPTGNSPHKVAETIRSVGVINESDLPFTKDIYSWDNYYSPKPMTSIYLSKGQNWLKLNDFKHEWVYSSSSLKAVDSVPLMKAALKRSPLGISVAAWYTNNGSDDVYVKPIGTTENHWVTCYGWDDVKRAWKIFDSYDNTHKLYSFDADISMAKMYWDIRTVETYTNYNFFWNFFYQILKNFMTPQTTPANLKVVAFCSAIKDHEGYFPGSRSFVNNNPGNLKFCGQALATGQDDKGFAKFATFQDGWKTLINMITNAASGKSKVYSPNDTISDFFLKYAPAFENNSDAYAKAVATAIGAPVSMPIKNLIS